LVEKTDVTTTATSTSSGRSAVPAHGPVRRCRAAASVALTAVASLGGAAPAAAHHGFEGRYDASRPLYVEGVVTDRSDGYPHGLIIIDPAAPTEPPADLRALDADDYKALGGRGVVNGARPVRATGAGSLALLLTPAMSTEVAQLGAPPGRGDDVGALVFRECDTHELLVQLLRLSARQRVIRSDDEHSEVDGCEDREEEEGWPDDEGEQDAWPSAADADDAATKRAERKDSVPVATAEPADDGGLSPLPMAIGAVGAGLTALGGGLVAGRRGRRRDE
jgi:hypothetical protein